MDVRSATLLILLAASCRVINAQGGLALSDSATSDSSRDTSARETLLVLLDGQIKSGHVTPRPDGYDIQVPGGRMYINSDRVRFAAASLPEAYDLMRDSMAELTPVSHLELARWCLANKLHTQARREVLDALYLDPNRQDAKRMLQALEHFGQDANAPNLRTGLTEYPSQSEILHPKFETRSLAGLSRSIASSFVSDVQPLLMNKCATSGCHGRGTQSQFTIVSTLRGSTPALAERNLAAVLNQIDFAKPSDSPLLKTGEQAHGNLVLSPFRGRAGAMQMQILRDWVQQASHDIAPDAAKAAIGLRQPEQKSQPSAIQQVSATVDHRSENRRSDVRSIGAARQMPENPHSRRLSTEVADKRFLHEAKYANRNDAFSPDDFNRRFHGGRPGVAENSSTVSISQATNPVSENIDAQDP